MVRLREISGLVAVINRWAMSGNASFISEEISAGYPAAAILF
jgi:hypothetical protein